MEIKVIKAFNDRENGFVTRPVNEVFEASDERARELIEKGFVKSPESAEESSVSDETGNDIITEDTEEKKLAKRRRREEHT